MLEKKIWIILNVHVHNSVQWIFYAEELEQITLK